MLFSHFVTNVISHLVTNVISHFITVFPDFIEVPIDAENMISFACNFVKIGWILQDINKYFKHFFMSMLHFFAFVPKCWISIFDLGSQISDLPPDSQISFKFSDFQTCFLDFSLSFQYFCTRIGAKDLALKRTTFPFLGFLNGPLVAEIFHFYCSKLIWTALRTKQCDTRIN